MHVVDGLAGEQRVRAARVVADHPAEAAAAVCRRVRAECQLVALCLCSKRIQDHAGLDAGNALLDIHLENAIHVLREVEHDCDVAALTGQARAGAAGEYRRLERSAARRPRRARRLRRVAPQHQWVPAGSSRRRWRTAPGCRDRSALRRAPRAGARCRARRRVRKCRSVFREN